MKPRKLNENMFAGGMFGPGVDFTLSPSSHAVQGTTTGYYYAIRGFDDTLQQKQNYAPDEYYIYPGCTVRGVGYNNPDKHYTGKVYRIVKNTKGEIIALYILATKTSKFVTVRADDNLELLLPKEPESVNPYMMGISDNMTLSDIKNVY